MSIKNNAAPIARGSGKVSSLTSDFEAGAESNWKVDSDYRHFYMSSTYPAGSVSEGSVGSSKAYAYSTMSSGVEESEPSSPVNGPPTNFAEVAPGIYRSAFPKLGNFDHLSSLGLKTILTLVPEQYPNENVDFVKENGIQHFQIPIPANKDPFDTIPPESIKRALMILMDPAYHPVLIHCNKGKHRTGCVIGCYRKVHDWTMGAIIGEYRQYAAHKARVLDERFIELFDEQTAMVGLKKHSGQGPAQSVPIPTPPSSDKYDPQDDILPKPRSYRGSSKLSDYESAE